MKPAAYAVLNLEALQHNLARARSCCGSARIMAVIKANAYGHGLLRAAEALHGVDAFAVARVDEAVRLRRANFQQRIVVLEGFICREELDSMLDFDLEAVIHDPRQLQQLEQLLVPGKRIKVWLKLDTGMNRLGFKPASFVVAYQRLMDCSVVAKPFGLMTHLANADNLEDDKTLKQIALFNRATANYPGECSIANSAGILGWPMSLADWARPGIMLYGVSPYPENCGRQLGLIPVMSLHSRLIAVKKIQACEAVGYGGDWVCPKETLLGVVAIGYGDGYPRHAVSGTPVLVNGVRVPMIGRVSMDMITVDLENCPAAQPGDPVTLWGEGLPVEEIASHAATIPYTLLCGITQRVQIVEE